MPDDLYERDILSWSEHQAELLRRVARGERVNGVDWEHVVEEIEDVGLSELNAVQSFLRLILVHLMKVQGWPENLSVEHWRDEIALFQQEAVQRFAPSMRQRIDLARIFERAQRQLAHAAYDGCPAPAWPTVCPFSLDQLLNTPLPTLEAMLTERPAN